MGTTKFDLSRLDRDELFEYRALQKKERDVNGDMEKFTLQELIQYTEILRKLEGLPSAYVNVIDPVWPDGEHRTLKTPRHPKTTAYCHWCGTLGALTHTNSSVPGAYCSEQCLENSQLARQRRGSGVAAASASAPAEPVAIAQAAAPVKPAAPATPAPAEKLKPPSDSALSAARQLDSLMRFGV